MARRYGRRAIEVAAAKFGSSKKAICCDEHDDTELRIFR